MTIINYASSGINKLKASLNENARVIIYDHHMFIVQATGEVKKGLLIYQGLRPFSALVQFAIVIEHKLTTWTRNKMFRMPKKA